MSCFNFLRTRCRELHRRAPRVQSSNASQFDRRRNESPQFPAGRRKMWPRRAASLRGANFKDARFLRPSKENITCLFVSFDSLRLDWRRNIEHQHLGIGSLRQFLKERAASCGESQTRFGRPWCCLDYQHTPGAASNVSSGARTTAGVQLSGVYLTGKLTICPPCRTPSTTAVGTRSPNQSHFEERRLLRLPLGGRVQIHLV